MLAPDVHHSIRKVKKVSLGIEPEVYYFFNGCIVSTLNQILEFVINWST